MITIFSVGFPNRDDTVHRMAAREYYLLFVLAVSCFGLVSSSNCYNHQKITYEAQFKPTYCDDTCTVTPFFSPDHSLDTYVNLIEEASESIDILTPGFDSWSQCTHYGSLCHGDCIGCALEDQRNEAFPVFPALLNAVHRKGVSVRLLTNNYTLTTCQGKIAPLDWFYLNGIEVRSYTTTTFMHAKYMMIDGGKKTAVSSVNWSQTSFTKNREAGVILEDCSCSAISFYKLVFNHDWEMGEEYKLDQTYSSSELSYIQDKSTMPVNVPPPPSIPGAYMPPLKTYSGVSIKKAYTSPDNARATIMSDFPTIYKSLQLAIYQVTDNADGGLCDQLLDLWNRGVNVSLLVSDGIVSYYEWKEAQECYGKLYNNGMQGRIQKSYSKLEFSHEKYWIVDETEVHLSTGNWSPSDFPAGNSFPSYTITHHSVNRNLLIVMEDPGVVTMFQTVFNNDWAVGKEWQPKPMQ